MTSIQGLSLHKSNDSWNELYILHQSNPVSYDYFGFSVSLDGNRALIGAPGDWSGTDTPGAAYIIEFNQTSWIEKAKLNSSDGSPQDKFGLSVSLDNDIALIGAPDDITGLKKGSAYIFRFDGTSWNEEQKLLPSDNALNFGCQVAIQGDLALVGSTDENAVYFFKFNGSSWNEEQKITPSVASIWAKFGVSINIDNNVMIVGAHQDDTPGTSAGSAFIFRYNGTKWNEEQKLIGLEEDEYDAFGYSSDIAGNYSIIGAVGTQNGGAAYIFEYNGTSWIQKTRLLANTNPHDAFGHSVSIQNEKAIVGAFRTDINGTNTGSAYYFKRNNSAWNLNSMITASDINDGNQFGISVAIDNPYLLIGSNGNNIGGTNTGSAYIFHQGGFIDINQSIHDRGFPIRHAADGDWAGAQNFLPTVDHVSNLSIYLRKFGNPEFNLTIELREEGIDGTPIDTLIFTPNEIPSSWTWLDLEINDLTVTPGVDYFIKIPPAPSGVTTSFGYEWGYAFGNQYDDGAFWFTRDGGNLWRDLPTMYEFMFRTYGYS